MLSWDSALGSCPNVGESIAIQTAHHAIGLKFISRSRIGPTVAEYTMVSCQLSTDDLQGVTRVSVDDRYWRDRAQFLICGFRGGLFLLLDFAFPDFLPAFVEGFFGEKRFGDSRVVLTLVKEHLVNLDSIALAGKLKRGLNAADGVVIRVVLELVRFHARVCIARVDDFSNRQVV